MGRRVTARLFVRSSLCAIEKNSLRTMPGTSIDPCLFDFSENRSYSSSALKLGDRETKPPMMISLSALGVTSTGLAGEKKDWDDEAEEGVVKAEEVDRGGVENWVEYIGGGVMGVWRGVGLGRIGLIVKSRFE